MKSSDKFESIFGICFIVILVVGFIWCGIQEHKTNKKYGKIQYEFVIIDKYDDLGSNWHLVGGRATEQEYHIIYKYRVTNRPDDDDNLKWYLGEATVSGSYYRTLQIGQTFYRNSSIFPYSY